METNWTPSEAMLKVDVELGLKHASRCLDSTKCGAKSCTRLKRLLAHPGGCDVKTAGGCELCAWYWNVTSLHAKQCKDKTCTVPHCLNLRPVKKTGGAKSFLSFLPSRLSRKNTASSSIEFVDVDRRPSREDENVDWDEEEAHDSFDNTMK